MGLKAAVAGLLIGASAAAGGYWYYSPVMAMQSMRTAAEARNAETFNQYVDYVSLRESLKGQMAALVTEQLGTRGSSGAESLGAMMGLALLNPLIDAMVRPEVVMRAMQSGSIEADTNQGGSNRGEPNQPASQREEVRWEIERQGLNRVMAYGMEPGVADRSEAFGVVFDRQGLVQWKLTEVRLPAGQGR